MSDKRKAEKKHQPIHPVLDVISGKTNSKVSKDLTVKVSSLRNLWLLAKMSHDVRSEEFDLER